MKLLLPILMFCLLPFAGLNASTVHRIDKPELGGYDSLQYGTYASGELELKKLPRSVRRFIRQLKKPLHDLLPSIPQGRLLDDGRVESMQLQEHIKTYFVPISIDSLWDHYTSISLIDAWTCPSSTFGLVFNKDNDSIYYSDADSPPRITQNSIFLMQLSIAGFYNIPVAAQVTKVDHENRTVEFTYLSDNVTLGRQMLQFTTVDGVSQINHATYFSSGHRLRDKLYPRFHELIIDEFHSGVISLME